MADKELEHIEQYLRNELPEAERVAFEQKMAADAAFRHQVELHGRTVQAVRLKGRQALKDRLKERPKPVPGDWQAKRRWLLVALLVVAALSVLWWKMGPRTANQKTPANTTTNQVDTVANPPAERQNPPDNTKSPTPPTKPPVVNRQMDTGKLFAAYFQPYKDETLNPSVRAEDGQDAFDRFVQLYLEGRHTEALGAFEKLSPALKNSDNVLFLKANSLLATGKASEAAALLEMMVENPSRRFKYAAEAKWYLALSLLKKGNWEATKMQLKSIAADENSPRQADAEKLLGEIK